MEHASAINSLKPYFRFPLRGDRVTERFLIGSALFLASFIIPILPALFVVGYGIQVMRRATAGGAPAMHAWQDWGGMLKDGFRAWIIVMAFFLPGTIVLLFGYGAYFASFLAFSTSTGNESDAAVLLPFFLGMGSLLLSLALGSILFLLASIPLPVALAHFAAEDKFAAAFRFRQWWLILRSNLTSFLIAWVIVVGLMGVVYVLSITAYFTLVLICLLPLLLLPAYFYVMLVGASLFGDLYAEGRAKAQELSP
jgi:hypothetical protein